MKVLIKHLKQQKSDEHLLTKTSTLETMLELNITLCEAEIAKRGAIAPGEKDGEGEKRGRGELDLEKEN